MRLAYMGLMGSWVALWADGDAGVAAVIVAISGLVTTVVAGVVALVKLLRRDDVTDRRVDLLWQANLRRGAVESSSALKRLKGANEVDTLLHPAQLLRPDVVAAYEPVAPYLRELRRNNPGIGRVAFAELVETNLGDWMMRYICMPMNVSSYACHDAAWEVSEMRPSEVVTAVKAEAQKDGPP